MPNFLWNLLSLPPTKGDVRAVRSTVTEVSAAEINTITSALADLRTAYLNGEVQPNPNGATVVAPADTTRFRVNTDGTAQRSIDGGRWHNAGRAEPKIHNALDYGADPTGVADSTAAINATITAAREGNRGLSAYLPAGNYRVTNTILIKGVRPFRFFGDGRELTRITWDGVGQWQPATAYTVGATRVNGYRMYTCTTAGTSAAQVLPVTSNPVGTFGGPTGTGTGIVDGTAVWSYTSERGADIVRVENAQYVEISDMELRGTSTAAKRPRACLHSSFDFNGGVYDYVIAQCNFRNLWLGGVGQSTGLPNMCDYGVLVATKNTDYNNSEHQFDFVDMECCAFAGVSLQQTQAKTIVFNRCNIGSSSRGVHTTSGAFYWYNGNINCVLADREGVCFEIGAPNDNIVVEGMNSESTGRLLKMLNYGGAGFPITIRNSRWAADIANMDGNVIDYKYRGPLIIEGNVFDAWLTDGIINQFTLASSEAFTSAIVRGNSFNAVSTDANSCVKNGAAAGVLEENNVYANAGDSRRTRAHAGSMSFAPTEVTKTHTFEVPTHLGPSSAIRYRIAATIVARTGAAGITISTISKTATGFTVTLSAAIPAGEAVTLDWQIAWI